ncbi:MAG: ChaN family lipoprotein, partial [Candidatus Woesearchaeota archaeon]
KYSQDYIEDFRQWALSSEECLFNDVAKSDKIFVGDFHTVKQPKEMLLQIAQAILNKGRPVTICLEMVLSRQQQLLESYLAGRVSEREFLNKINYYKDWGFCWPYYRQIFEFASKHKEMVKLVGIDSNRNAFNCYLRDDHAAKIIYSEIKNSPERAVIVFAGDLHIASKHLPYKTKKLIGQDAKSLIIYQNKSSIYWSLGREGKLKEEGLIKGVVKIGDKGYCVLNIHPAIKWFSYLVWEKQRKIKSKTAIENIYKKCAQIVEELCKCKKDKSLK